ncbi:hypothetical protein PIROE2DRAFT_15563, partial [Piromyces sp. E2]
KKEPIGKIDIHTLKSVGLPNPEYNSMPNCFCIEFEQGKDLADIVGVYQKEGDYNETVVVEDSKKYARVKPKEELLLKKEVMVNNGGGSNSNVNSNNTLYSSKKEDLNELTNEEKKEEKEEKVVEKEGKEEMEQDASAEVKEALQESEKKDETLNSLDNVAINVDTIEDIIKNITIDVNKEPDETNLSNNTLHQQQQEKIPYYEWINRVVTKSSAFFYTDSAPKLNQWIKTIEESPCFQISK